MNTKYIYVGRIEHLKGIDVLLRAWKLIQPSDMSLEVFGDGPLISWCLRYLQSNSIGNVHFRGQVPHDQVMKMISESDAMIVPSQWFEGFPMTIAEAYSVGTPVIGSNMGNVGNLIVPYLTGQTFEYNGLENIAKILASFNKDRYSRRKILQYFQENYSAEKNFKMLMNIYDHVAEDKA